MSNGNFFAHYRFETYDKPEHVFRAMAKEQTTTGYNTIKQSFISLEDFRAEIHSINVEWIGDKVYRGTVCVRFPAVNLSSSGNPFEDMLCFAIGESRHVRGITKLKLLDLELPVSIMPSLNGPTYGVVGLRQLLDVWDRPVLLGPLRPEVGFSSAEYARVAFEAFMGGADIVKDDELLVDPSYSSLESRAKLCADAARRAEDATGEHKMFVLNIGTDLTRFRHHIDYGQNAGVDGLMVHPRLTPSLLSYTRTLTELPLLAHYDTLPTFATIPEEGIRFGLLAKLYRLSGADLVAFPRPNPRFDINSEDYEDCLHICLDRKLGVRKSMPMPTGGNMLESVRECQSIVRSIDYAFVSGSALFEHSRGIRAGSRELRSALERIR